MSEIATHLQEPIDKESGKSNTQSVLRGIDIG